MNPIFLEANASLVRLEHFHSMEQYVKHVTMEHIAWEGGQSVPIAPMDTSKCQVTSA